MKYCILALVILGFLSSTFAQINAGNAWEGTWSDGKRNGGGNFFLCVDPETNQAHGSYSGIGLVSGYLHGNIFSGFWYEAGYDRPFGPFSLTISGDSFSGTWSYYEDDGVVSNTTFTWSGSRSSRGSPDEQTECLVPYSYGKYAGGNYGKSFICDHQGFNYQDTNQPSVFGSFANFGRVAGYTFDTGVSLLLSDFHYASDISDLSVLRPENNETPFGPGSFSNNLPGEHGEDDDDTIYTSRIVVGRLVSAQRFCGFFWEGLYNVLLTEGPICLDRTDATQPDPAACGTDTEFVLQQVHRYDDGETSAILQAVQDAFDALTLPPVIAITEESFVGANGAKEYNHIQGDFNSATTLSVSALLLLSIILAAF